MTKSKVKLLRLKNNPLWTYRSGDGTVSLYTSKDKLSVERAGFLLDMAKAELLKQAENL